MSWYCQIQSKMFPKVKALCTPETILPGFKNKMKYIIALLPGPGFMFAQAGQAVRTTINMMIYRSTDEYAMRATNFNKPRDKINGLSKKQRKLTTSKSCPMNRVQAYE